MSAFDFKILGPLEVSRSDRRVELGGAKQRALLAVLLLHPNEVVSSDRLITDLWGEEAPAGAAKTLQVHVSRLRKLLAPERASGDPDHVLATRPPGYVLNVEPGSLDLAEFERLCAEARAARRAGEPEAARERLGEALGLWRGPALDDLAYEPFAQSEVARLDELRLAAIEDRLEADLELGDHGDLVGELDALVAEHPLRERLRAQHMLALYRSGRQAEALEAYQEARRALTEELGIDPGRELRELQEAILRQAPELDVAPAAARSAAPTEPSAPTGVFVGRERELETLDRALEDALAGHGRLVLVAGEPGIGKSRLSDELIRRGRAHGAEVLVGRCWEAGGAPAYWPWVQSLREHVRAAEPEALREQLGPGAAELSHLFPELRELFPDLPEPPALESDGARFRLFEAVVAFLRRATGDQPIVLVLDDLHAADEPSLLMLRYVVRQIGPDRILIACLYRDVDPTLRAPLEATLADLLREPQTAQLTLAGLGRPELAEYLERTTGDEPPAPLVEAIHTETEGNPLFIGETVRLLVSEGRLGEADAHLGIPPSVRSVIGQRVARLSPRCRDPLLAASVLGREFGLDALAELSGLERPELIDVLDEAMGERVVSDVPGSPGRLRFGHALIRDTLYDELTPARRLALHQAAGEALEVVYAADQDSHLAELAQQFIAAAPAGVEDKALEYARRAGDRAAVQLAFEEATRLYNMGLTLAADPAMRCELLLARGDAQGRAGDTPASKLSFREAAELASDRDLTEYFARAALGYGGRVIWEVSRDDDYLVPLLTGALAALGDEDSSLRVKLLVRLGGGPYRDAGHPPELKRELTEEALAMARRLGDPETLCYGIQGYILGHHSPDHSEGQLELANELMGLLEGLGDKERLVEAHEVRVNSLVELGQVDAARESLKTLRRLAAELRQPSQEWLAIDYSATLALLEGRFADAHVLMEQARALGERPLGAHAAVTYRVQVYLLHREQGRLAEIEDLIRDAARAYPTYRILRCTLAQALWALGHDAEAQAALDELSADDFALLPFDEEWTVSMALLAETACGLRDGERAAAIHDRLAPYADRVSLSYPEISLGAVARYLGMTAALLERWADAESHFEAAIERNRAIGAPSWLAHTQRDYGQMLIARGEAGDEERARGLLEEAGRAYETLGIPPPG